MPEVASEWQVQLEAALRAARRNSREVVLMQRHASISSGALPASIFPKRKPSGALAMLTEDVEGLRAALGVVTDATHIMAIRSANVPAANSGIPGQACINISLSCELQLMQPGVASGSARAQPAAGSARFSNGSIYQRHKVAALQELVESGRLKQGSEVPSFTDMLHLHSKCSHNIYLDLMLQQISMPSGTASMHLAKLVQLRWIW